MAWREDSIKFNLSLLLLQIRVPRLHGSFGRSMNVTNGMSQKGLPRAIKEIRESILGRKAQLLWGSVRHGSIFHSITTIIPRGQSKLLRMIMRGKVGERREGESRSGLSSDWTNLFPLTFVFYFRVFWGDESRRLRDSEIEIWVTWNPTQFYKGGERRRERTPNIHIHTWGNHQRPRHRGHSKWGPPLEKSTSS